MKPLRTIELTHAAPVDGRGHGRTPAVQLMLDERDRYLREAAMFFSGSGREVARQLYTALSRYRDGRWRRDRSEALCPPEHRGKLTATLWAICKVQDRSVSEPTIRRAFGCSG